MVLLITRDVFVIGSAAAFAFTVARKLHFPGR